MKTAKKRGKNRRRAPPSQLKKPRRRLAAQPADAPPPPAQVPGNAEEGAINTPTSAQIPAPATQVLNPPLVTPGKGGRPGTDRDIVEQLKGWLKEQWRAWTQPQPPKQEHDGVRLIQDRLEAIGLPRDHIGGKTILRKIVAPVWRKLFKK